jgi:deoxyribonuclease V
MISMRDAPLPLAHSWDLTPKEAVSLQRELAQYVVREDRLDPVELVAGLDVGFEGGQARAAVAVLSFPALELVNQAVACMPVQFPYIPGLLSFREIPAVLAALGALTSRPHLLLCDGQGIAHPRRCGFASHVGLATGIPSIGVAKSRLIGAHKAVPLTKGKWVPLMHHEETIGAVLRTRTGVAPLFVSIGHRVNLPTAIGYVLACTTHYRLPETTRWAHRLASGPRISRAGR